MEPNWNIPSESLIPDKLDELRQALESFPENRLAPVWRHAIEELEAQLPCSQD